MGIKGGDLIGMFKPRSLDNNHAVVFTLGVHLRLGVKKSIL